MEKECYEGDANPIRKTDYKPIIYLYVVTVCGNDCCVASVVRDSVFLAWSVEVCYMFCVWDVMDVVFSVCIVRLGVEL